MNTEAGQLRRSPACRCCGESLHDTVVDLGMSPLCESYVRPDQLNAVEAFYPLRVHVCRRCWLVQLEQYVSAEQIFSEYAYFSSFADSWVKHARDYVDNVIGRFGLGPRSCHGTIRSPQTPGRPLPEPGERPRRPFRRG